MPLDTSVTARTSYKKEIYMELVEALRVLYPRYKYKIISVVVGALGAIPKSLKQSLTELFKNYSEQRINNLIRKIQFKAIHGTTRTVKTFLNM